MGFTSEDRALDLEVLHVLDRAGHRQEDRFSWEGREDHRWVDRHQVDRCALVDPQGHR